MGTLRTVIFDVAARGVDAALREVPDRRAAEDVAEPAVEQGAGHGGGAGQIGHGPRVDGRPSGGGEECSMLGPEPGSPSR